MQIDNNFCFSLIKKKRIFAPFIFFSIFLHLKYCSRGFLRCWNFVLQPLLAQTKVSLGYFLRKTKAPHVQECNEYNSTKFRAYLGKGNRKTPVDKLFSKQQLWFLSNLPGCCQRATSSVVFISVFCSRHSHFPCSQIQPNEEKYA